MKVSRPASLHPAPKARCWKQKVSDVGRDLEAVQVESVERKVGT